MRKPPRFRVERTELAWRIIDTKHDDMPLHFPTRAEARAECAWLNDTEAGSMVDVFAHARRKRERK